MTICTTRNPCRNGGLCRADSALAPGFYCLCPIGYAGTACDTREYRQRVCVCVCVCVCMFFRYMCTRHVRAWKCSPALVPVTSKCVCVVFLSDWDLGPAHNVSKTNLRHELNCIADT